jgi:hypothetical protein
MTIQQKVALVEEVQEDYGLSPALSAVDLAKSTWYYHHGRKVDYEKRGLDPQEVKLVISDKCRGMLAAIETVFPYSDHQNCLFHSVPGMAHSKCQHRFLS